MILIKYSVFIFLVFFSVSNIICASDNIELSAEDLKQTTKTYMRYCAKCHGKEAKGDGRMNRLYLKLGIYMPSNFTIGYFKDRPSDYLKKIITHGGGNNNRSKYMPPFVDELSKEKIDQLVKFIQLIGKNRKFP